MIPTEEQRAFKLRPWRLGDLPDLVHYANDIHVARNMTDGFPHPYTEADGRAFIERATGPSPNQVLAIEVDGKAAGGIGIHPLTDIYRMNAELGYWLAKDFWGRGIMTNAVKQIVKYGFDHWEINRIFARPFGTNVASQRVLEKAGFRLEARFERTILKAEAYFDELVYSIRKPDV